MTKNETTRVNPLNRTNPISGMSASNSDVTLESVHFFFFFRDGALWEGAKVSFAPSFLAAAPCAACIFIN